MRDKSLKIFFLCFFFSLVLLGCSSPTTPSKMEAWTLQSDRIKVLSTTAMIDDVVGQIGKERIDHIPLITGEIDPHSYELVKGDDEKLSLATIIFYNGLGLEHGASLHYQIEHHRNAIGVGNIILEKQPELILQSGKDIDPHIWMDISLWSCIIEPIVRALSQADPDGKAFYQANGQQLLEKMLQEHRRIHEAFLRIPEEKRFLVTSHDAFNYFARAYLAFSEETAREHWQHRCDAPEGLAPDAQLSASDIQKIVDHLIKYQIQTVFPESNVSRDSLKKVVHACAQKGLKVTISQDALYGDAMGPPNSNADTYLKMIGHDADVLIEAWK
jgi:manganese/zinc/iron transport system substrate-binding protein